MTFLVPGLLVAAGIVSAIVIALHFIGTRDPETVPLPTARFAPERPIRAKTRAIRLPDLLLLGLRVAIVMAVGAALARPVFHAPRRAVARILLVDRSRAVANRAELVDSARALFAAGGALVLFDSSAHLTGRGAADSLRSLVVSTRAGRLSSALIVALRAASTMRDAADSLELAIVSPFAVEELDAATDSIRALWPGAVRLVRVAARAEPVTQPEITVSALPDDPLRLALPQTGNEGRGTERGVALPTVRVVRGTLGVDDSTWAMGSGHVLVHWPATTTMAEALGSEWVSRAPVDTVGAVMAGDDVVVAPFERALASRCCRVALHEAHVTQLGRAPIAESRVSTVRARWVDGAPAAVEARTGAGCIRSVAVPVPSRGDLVLQPRFARFVAALLGPCAGDGNFASLPSVRAAAFAGPVARRVVASRSIAAPEEVASPLATWLLIAAACCALGELVVRRRAAGALRMGPP